MILLCDGGSDESPSKIAFMNLLGRLWDYYDFDILVAVTYCPGDSRLNPIERYWGGCTQLAGSAKLSMDTDKAMRQLRKLLDNKTYLGSPIFIEITEPGEFDEEIH